MWMGATTGVFAESVALCWYSGQGSRERRCMRGWRGELAWEATWDGRRTPGENSTALLREEHRDLLRDAKDPGTQVKVELEIRLET